MSDKDKNRAMDERIRERMTPADARRAWLVEKAEDIIGRARTNGAGYEMATGTESEELDKEGDALVEELAALLDGPLGPLEEALLEVERSCPCGARPESPKTHPHVTGCRVGAVLARLPWKEEGKG